MKKIDYKYNDVKKFIEANYKKDKNKIEEIGIEEYNDFFVDNILGSKIFENEIEEFIHTLAICLVMRELNLNDNYFYSTLEELLSYYLKGNYDDYFYDINDKKEIDIDIKDFLN